MYRFVFFGYSQELCHLNSFNFIFFLIPIKLDVCHNGESAFFLVICFISLGKSRMLSSVFEAAYC